LAIIEGEGRECSRYRVDVARILADFRELPYYQRKKYIYTDSETTSANEKRSTKTAAIGRKSRKRSPAGSPVLNQRTRLNL
jgi:hypothetical protein